MSTMLEQAIVDAKSLRESAIQNAENQVIEKYSIEVKAAVKKLLEQEEEAAEENEGDDNSTTMEQVPLAHLGEEEEEIVVVDLDDIVAAADESPEDEELELDREEIASEVGLELDSEPVANRSDEEIDLDEGALLDMFKEMLVVDVSPEAERAAERYNQEEEAEEEQEEYYVSTARDEGMSEKDIEDSKRHTARLEMMENTKKENTKLRKLLEKAKTRLLEVNVSNARLLYANKVLQNSSLNEQQKDKIVNLLSEASSADEAKTIYDTLQKTMESSPSRGVPQSLSEAVTKRSSVILSSRRSEESNDKKPELSRWAKLAGLTNE